MSDPRRKKLASILVKYSVRVEPGEWVVVQGNPISLPLMNAVFEQVLRSGGYPTVYLNSGEIEETNYLFATEEQLKWHSPISELIYSKADVLISIWSTENLRSLSGIDPQKQRLRNLAHKDIFQTFITRMTNGELKWVGTQDPCQAYAQEADMSLREFESFVYSATLADQTDPIAQWQALKNNQQNLVDWLNGKNNLEVRGPHVDLTLSCEGRK